MIGFVVEALLAVSAGFAGGVSGAFWLHHRARVRAQLRAREAFARLGAVR